MAYAALAAFANICNSDVNQAHVGSIQNLVEAAVRICDRARDTFLVTEVANFFLACVWNCTINKARVASRGGCAALVKRIKKHAMASSSEEDIRCTEKLCLALSSILLYSASHERMFVIGGLDEIVGLCRQLHEPRILQGLAKIVVAMTPPPEELLRLHKDDSKAPVERLDALTVLKKAKFGGYSDMQTVPEWLEKAILYLSMTDTSLRALSEQEQRWLKVEFVAKSEFCKELVVEVHPDATVQDNKDFRGLIFSIY